MRTLYDPIEPSEQGSLKVSPLHTLHYEVCGTPAGTPVVFLHGGPGGGTNPDHRRFFDPAAYRIVLIPDDKVIAEFGDPLKALALARIECHYFVNHAFFEGDAHLIERVGAIRRVPAVIVQGRYDVVCPTMSAWDLRRAWPEADLQIVPDAGHHALEPGIVDALVRATDRFRGAA